ncbi:hypothetical protein SprV_0100121100 [Sparganum proliferum]
MVAHVTNDGPVPEAFAVTNGVKWDCAHVPILCSITYSAVLLGAHLDECSGIRIIYRTEGQPLKRRSMQAPTSLFTTTVYELLLADDCSINTATEQDMQRKMCLFATGGADFATNINTDKKVVMHQTSPDTEYNVLASPPTTLDSKPLTTPPILTAHSFSIKIDNGVARRI